MIFLKYKIQLTYLALVIFCFLFFSHTDPIYTIAASLSYLNGHAKDFYDFNDLNFGESVYLPTIYLIIASWFSIIISLVSNSVIEAQKFLLNTPVVRLFSLEYSAIMLWYKSLLIFFSFFTYVYIKKIARLIPGNKIKNELIFITSPFFIFSVFIFSGYDIFSVFFTILGMYFYFKKNFYRFALAFSVAITFKFFALVIFIPLLLLAEKNILKLIKFLFLGSLLCIFYFIFYIKSPSFLDNIFLIVKQKVQSKSLFSFKLLYLFIYFYLCFFCFSFKNYSENLFYKTAIFISFLSYSLIFLATKWHPNWILIMVPFSSLMYTYIKNYKLCFYFELIGFLSFTVLISNIWIDNVDQKMLTQGPLSYLFLKIYPCRISNIFDIHFLDYFGIHLKGLLILILYIYLFHPALIYFWENYAKKL
jgi:hypothetical protein